MGRMQQHPRYASIDIGTNSVLLLIAEWDGIRLTPVAERFRITRLGETYVQDGRIPEAAMQRTLKVLTEYIQEARAAGVQSLWCTGTQIFRKAKNAAAFVTRVREQLQLNIDVLSRDQEAVLTFQGALDTVADNPGPFWGIDIGGGSTEVALGTRQQMEFAHSFPIGGVQLKSRFGLGERMTPEEVKTVRETVRRQFMSVMPSGNAAAIGIGGTPTSLAALAQQLPEYQFEKIDGYLLSRLQLQSLFDQMNGLSLSEREALPGMEKGRADIILPATLVLDEFLAVTGNETLIVSARGLRYGVILWKLGVIPATVRPMMGHKASAENAVKVKGN